MIHSMTAYGASLSHSDTVSLNIEIRSVNHRYLEVSFRLPESLRALETVFRQRLQEKLKRGKVDCQFKLSMGREGGSLSLNQALVQSLLSTGASLAEQHQLPFDLTVSRLMLWPEVIQNDNTMNEDFQPILLSAFDKALDELQKARSIEGQKLKQYLLNQLHLLNTEIAKARTEALISTGLTRDKLLSRLAQFNIEIPAQRIEQELALLMAKMDVTEEIDRLVAHSEEFERILNDTQAHGKRLDFLVQELNREANTLASKSDSVVLTKIAVEIKVLIEQMREQIQNIE